MVHSSSRSIGITLLGAALLCSGLASASDLVLGASDLVNSANAVVLGTVDAVTVEGEIARLSFRPTRWIRGDISRPAAMEVISSSERWSSRRIGDQVVLFLKRGNAQGVWTVLGAEGEGEAQVVDKYVFVSPVIAKRPRAYAINGREYVGGRLSLNDFLDFARNKKLPPELRGRKPAKPKSPQKPDARTDVDPSEAGENGQRKPRNGSTKARTTKARTDVDPFEASQDGQQKPRNGSR